MALGQLVLADFCPSLPCAHLIQASPPQREGPRERLFVSPRPPEENRLTAAQASGNLHLDPSQHVNTRIQAELQKEKLTPEMAIHRDRRQEPKTKEEQQDFSAPSVGPHHSKSHKSHRLSYVSSEGYNLEASFPSHNDSGETDDGEHTSLSSQVCSETTSATSSDTAEEEE